MELNENLRYNLIKLRKDRNVTQEILATTLDISIQAISKWETGVSLPDIMQLPRISKFYGVTIDYLFYHEGKDQNIINGELPNDDILRIIQFRGNKMLSADLWERDKFIDLKIPEDVSTDKTDRELNVQIWGNANIEGDIGSYVECDGELNCGNIAGYVEGRSGINCGNIGAYAEAGGGINSGNIGGYVECGGGINCGNIGGYVECGGGLNCGNIDGYVECGGGINCGDINGNAECQGDLKCSIIKGQVVCEGDIHCTEIQGDAKCEGDIIYEK